MSRLDAVDLRSAWAEGVQAEREGNSGQSTRRCNFRLVCFLCCSLTRLEIEFVPNNIQLGMADDNSVKAIVQGVEGPPNYDPSSPRSPDGSPTESRSGIVKRAMERTADRLHRSKSASNKAQLSQSQPSLPITGHKRIFSLSSRKGKERVPSEGDGKHVVYAYA